MTTYRDDDELDPNGQYDLDQTLVSLTLLGSRVAERAAMEIFRSVTHRPGWTNAELEVEAERAISRMEIAARDSITAAGADPDSGQWPLVWLEMQKSYRQMIASIMRGSEMPGRETLQ